MLYRLARARYANLSGIGAALQPGRWNVAGEEAIYTSTEIAVPVLERLVHTPKDMIPSNLAMMTLQIAGEWGEAAEVEGGGILLNHRAGACLMIYKTLRQSFAAAERRPLGSSRLRDHALMREYGPPLAVAVPSVIVPAWNVILYPQGRGFWDHVKLISVEPFAFDPRLFPENAATEPIA